MEVKTAEKTPDRLTIHRPKPSHPWNNTSSDQGELTGLATLGVTLHVDTSESQYQAKYQKIKTIDDTLIHELYADIETVLSNHESEEYQCAIKKSKTFHTGPATCNQAVHRLVIMNFAYYNPILLVHLLNYFFHHHIATCADCTLATPEQMAELIRHHTDIKLPETIAYNITTDTANTKHYHPLSFAMSFGLENVAITVFLLYSNTPQNKSFYETVATLAHDNDKISKTSRLHKLIAAKIGKKNCCSGCWGCFKRLKCWK